MAARRRIDKKQKQVYIICAIVTLVILGVMFGIYKHRLSQVAPVLEIRVENLEAQTPAEAQAACRGDYTRFAEAMEGHEGCAWVWTGKHKLYLVRPEALEIVASAEEPVELGRIKVTDAQEINYESVSMTVRMALRSGEISYENAVYLWEKDTDLVLAVRPDTYKTVEGSIVSFTDDGGVTHTCYILDTEI